MPNKDQREVDFLIVKNQQPWLLLEVKASANQSLSEHLYHYQAQLKPPHVLQLAFNLPYVKQDCFTLRTPKIVPAITFLSQLV